MIKGKLVIYDDETGDVLQEISRISPKEVLKMPVYNCTVYKFTLNHMVSFSNELMATIQSKEIK